MPSRRRRAAQQRTPQAQRRTPEAPGLGAAAQGMGPPEVEETEFDGGLGGMLDAVAAQASSAPPDGSGGGDEPPPGEPLPHRAKMEAALGVDLSDVRVIRSSQLGGIGARAAATADAIFLGDDDSIEVVAEEVVHYLQAQGSGALSGVSNPDDPEEVEARAIAEQIAMGRPVDAITQRSGSAVMRNADGLTASERRQLRQLARDHADDLHDELDDSWVVDSSVRRELAQFWTAVRRINSAGWFVDQARQILIDTYADQWGIGLVRHIRQGTDGDDQAALVEQLRVRNIAPPEDTSSDEDSDAADQASTPTADTDTDTDSDADSGDEAPGGSRPARGGDTPPAPPARDFSTDERALVDQLTDRCVATIRTELRATFYCQDSNVLAGLRQWNSAILALIDRRSPAPSESNRGALVRRAQAILRHRYGRLTTHRLDQDVQNGMEMDSEDEAFRLIGTPNGPSTDPAPEPETDRMRCWPHCQTLQREIQGMRNAMMPSVYVDDIDNAHQAAVDACTSGSNAEKRALVAATYREVAGADLAAHLTLACSDKPDIARDLSGRLGIAIVVQGVDADELPEHAQRVDVSDTAVGYGAILQELNQEFRESWTDETDVHRLCTRLNRWAADAAGERDAANLRRWTEARDEQLRQAVEAYGRQFGTGLGNEIRSHVWGASQRACLDLIGDRGAVSDQVAAATVDPSEEGADELLAATDELTRALTPIAINLRDELTDMIANGGPVREECHNFHEVWDEKKDDPRFGDRMQSKGFARNILFQLYTDRGGNLVNDINDRLWDHADKDAAFRSLGLGYTALAVSLEEEGDAATADVGSMDSGQRLQQILHRHVIAIFQRVRDEVHPGSDEDRSSHFTRFANRLEELWDEAVRAANTHGQRGAAGRQAVLDAYETEHGVRLPVHLGMCCRTSREAERLTERIDSTVTATGGRGSEAEANTQGELDDSIEIGEGTRERFDDEGELQAFSREDAYRLARELHQAGERRDRADATRILGHDRPAPEREAIIAMFDATYPVSLRFFLRQQFGAEGADILLLEGAVEQGGLTPQQEIRHMVEARDESIYRTVMRMSEEERRQILNDASLMSDIRDAYGDDGYERIRNTLTGHLGFDDMMRTRNEETFWTMGTDEEGFQQDVREYVIMRRRELMPDILADGRAQGKHGAELQTWASAELRRRLEPELIRRSADADTIDTVFGELSATEFSDAMMRADTTSGELSSMQEALSDPTADDILTHLRACTDAEKRQLRANQDFLDQLRENSESTIRQAMAILRGEDGLASVEEGLDSWVDTDETQIFRGLTEGDAGQMQDIAGNASLQQRIRDDLDGSESDTLANQPMSERALFDSMMDEYDELDDVDASDVDARRARKRRELHLRHKYRVLGGMQDEEDDLLQAAQEAYNEQGAFTPDPDATPPAPENLWDVRGEHASQAALDRAAVKNEVQGPLHAVKGQPRSSDGRPNITKIVEDGILGRADPARERLGRALEYQTDEEGVQNSLDSVSNRTLAHHWSNIRRTGRNGGTFASVVKPWLDHNPPKPDEGRIWNRLVDFRLGIADDVDERLRDDFMVGDSELDTWRATLQRRILALPWEDVKSALEAEDCSGLTDADEEILIGADRQARSRVSHSADRFEQARGQGSAIDGATGTDDAVDRAALQLNSEFEGAVEGDGVLSDAEIERIRAREGDLAEAMREYREAKQEAAQYATYVAAAVIAAVGTVVSGPGGPSLAATLVTAVTQAAVTTALDEAIQGNDFDAVETGLRRAATECLTAGLTHGMNSLGSAALRRFEGLGDLVARANSWRQGLAAASRTSESALMTHAAVSAAIQAAGTIPSNATEAVVSMLDDLFTDGWDRAVENASLSDTVTDWSVAMLRTFVQGAVTTYTNEQIRRIFEPHLGDLPDDATAGDRARREGTLVARDAANEGSATLGRTAGGVAEDVARGRDVRALDTDSYDSDMVTDFAGRTLRRTANRHAENERDRANAAEADRLMQRPDIARGVRGVRSGDSPLTDAQVRAIYRARILSQGAPAEGEVDDDISEFRRGPLRRIEAGIQHELSEHPDISDADRTAFITWVVGSGGGAEGRAHRRAGYDTFLRERARRQELAARRSGGDESSGPAPATPAAPPAPAAPADG